MKNFLIIFFMCLNASAVFSQWSEQTVSPTPPRLNCVSAGIGGTEGWVGGDSGTILYTSNSGTNWYYRNNSAIGNKNINVISSIPGPFIFAFVTGKALCSAVLSNTTYIYRTTNYGNNWTIVYQKLGCIRAIRMLDTSNGYAIGDPVGGWWTILRTTNGGMSFDSLYTHPQQIGTELSNYNSFVCGTVPFDQLLMFGTNSGRIYRSTNGGQSWTTVTMPFQNILTVQLGKYYWSSQLNPIGYAAGSGAAFTTDYGATWTTQSLPGSGNIASFHTEFSLGSFACYSRGPVIYSSTNYTLSFTVQYTSPNGGNYTQMSLSVFQFESGWRGGWAVKDNGTLSRYYVMWAGVNKISSSIPDNFSLSQNYPNPFNPVTKIELDIPPSKGARGMIQLIIYDILGREIATLVNEPLSPGTYEVEWDGTNYPSGVYFYKLVVSGAEPLNNIGYFETKKMLLLK